MIFAANHREGGMSSLPIDLALTLAGAGVDITLDEDDLEHAIRSAIGDRRGYMGEVRLLEHGWEVELLSPVTETFTGRTRVTAHAWCLVFLMGETGELGINGFHA